LPKAQGTSRRKTRDATLGSKAPQQLKKTYPDPVSDPFNAAVYGGRVISMSFPASGSFAMMAA
jgi:hypothetical protein